MASADACKSMGWTMSLHSDFYGFVQVPLFVNIGEKISVDTRTDTYLGRGKKSF